MAAFENFTGQLDTAGTFEPFNGETDEAKAAREKRPGILREGAGQIKDALLYHLPGAFAGMLEGDQPFESRDWRDTLIERSRKRSEEVAAEPGAKDPLGPFGAFSREDVRSLGPSLGFSGAGALAGVAAGVPAAIGAGAIAGPAAPIAGPVAGYAAGGAANFEAARRMSMNQFLRDARAKDDADALKTRGAALTEDEWAQRQPSYMDSAGKYGLWEAGPEAASNLIQLAILATPAGRFLPANMLARGAVKLGGMTAAELPSETVTQMGQQPQSVKAGLEPGPERQFTKPADWWESFKEIVGPTVLQTAVMGGAGAAGVAAHRRLTAGREEPPEPVPATTPHDQALRTVARAVERTQEAAAQPDVPPPQEAATMPQGPSSGAQTAVQPAVSDDALLTTLRKLGGTPEQKGILTDDERAMLLGLGLARPNKSGGISGLPAARRRLRELEAQQPKEAQSDQPQPDAEAVATGDEAQATAEAEAAPGTQAPVLNPEPQSEAQVAESQALGTEPSDGGVATAPAPALPEEAATAIDAPAHEAATSPENELPEPSDAQKEAGNYRKGHIKVAGLDISIENPAGSKRRPEWGDLHDHYGYVKGVPARASDKDHVDVFVKPGTPEDYAGSVFVVDQQKTDGTFDEPKVVIGAADETEARALYQRNYTPDWKGLRDITPMPMDEFKSALQDEQRFQRPQRSEKWGQPQPESVSPVPAKPDEKSVASIEDIHKLATEKRIRFDDDPAFMDWTESIVGKRKLDELTPDERQRVHDAPKARPAARKLPAQRRAEANAKSQEKKQWHATREDLDPRWKTKAFGEMSMGEFLAQAKLSEQIFAAESAKTPQAKRAAFERAGRNFNPGAYRHMHPEGKPQPKEERQPKPGSAFLMAIKKSGGISSAFAAEIGGDSAVVMNRRLPGLFRKTGMSDDKLVEWALDNKYLTQHQIDEADGQTGGSPELAKDLVRRAIAGNDIPQVGEEEETFARRRDERDVKFARPEDLEEAGIEPTPENLEATELSAKAAALNADGFERLTIEHQDSSDSEFLAAVVKFIKEHSRADQRPNEADHRAGEEAGEARPAAAEEVTAERPKGDTDATLARFRPRGMVTFKKPYVGKTGAKLTGYEWKWRPEAIVDRRGEDRTIRVSDWEESITNAATSREIVHQFQVETKDGRVEVVSAETAATMLGVADTTARAAAKRLLEDEIRRAREEERLAEHKEKLDKMEWFQTPAAAIAGLRGALRNIWGRYAKWGEEKRASQYSNKDENARYSAEIRYRDMLDKRIWFTKGPKGYVALEEVTDDARGWERIELKPAEIWDENGNERPSPGDSVEQDKPDYTLDQPTEEELRKRAAAIKKAEEEKAKAEAAANKPKNVTADQVDLFNTQGSLFQRRGAYNEAQLELVYDQIETRPGTTEAQRSEGIAALRGLFAWDRRAGATLLGSALWKDFTERGGAELIGQRAETDLDLALLAQILRDPRFETLRFFFTKNGEIVGHTGITSRMPGVVAFVKTSLDGAGVMTKEQTDAYIKEATEKRDARVGELRDMMKNLGADGYWMLHNHPSGASTPSAQDRALTFTIAEKMDGFLGHVIIDQDEYSVIDADHGHRTHAIKGGTAGQAEMPHDLLGRSIMSPSAIMEIAKEIQRKDGFVTLVSRSGGTGRITAIAEVPEPLLTGISPKALAQSLIRVRRFARMSGGMDVFAVSSNPVALSHLVRDGAIIDAASSDVSIRRTGVNPLRDRRDYKTGPLSAAQPSPEEIDPDALTKGFLSRMDFRLKEMGYDSRGADDVREMLRTRMLRDGKLWHEDWIKAYEGAKADIDGVYARREARALETGKAKNVDFKRIRELGYTEDWREAGYITPAGSLIDLSGKREGGERGQRALDHREAGGTIGMQEFMALGNIRIDYNSGSFDISKAPTDRQIRRLTEFIEDRGGEVTVDLEEGLGELRGDYYLRALRAFSREYPAGTKAARVITDIKRFFSGQEPLALPRGRFSRDGRQRRAASGVSGLPPKEVQSIVDKITGAWKNPPKVKVLSTFADAPAPILRQDEEAKAKGAKGVPEAFLYQNTVYVVAEALPSTGSVVRALFHESLGHFGLRGAFGPQMRAVLQDVVRSQPDAVKAKAREYGLDWKNEDMRLEAAEEILAQMAQDKPHAGLVKRAIAAIRQFLRELGFDLKLSNDDLIVNFILPARRHVEMGAGTPGDGQAAMFARGSVFSDATAFAASIDRFIAKKGPAFPVRVTSTPDILTKLGLVDRDIYITPRVLQKVLHDKHALPANIVKSIPRELHDPVAVFDSATEPGSLVVLTGQIHQGRPVVVAVIRDVEISRQSVHAIATMHPREFDATLRKWVNEGLLNYVNEMKRPAWWTTGDQTSIKVGPTAQGAIGRILTEADFVKGAKDDEGRFSRAPWIDQQPPDTQEALRKAGVWHVPPTLKARVAEWSKDWQKRLKQGVVDQFDPIKSYDYHAYMLARMTRGADNALDGLLNYGTVFLDRDGAIDVNFQSGGFLGIMSKLAGEHDRFLGWVIGNRAERLLGEGREHNFTAQDIARLKALNQGQMKDGSSRAQEYARTRMELDRYNKSVLDIAEKAGLIDGAGRAAWEKDFYVPFYRLMEAEDGKPKGPMPSKGLVNQYAFKVLKGGEQALGDPMENILKNWSHLLDASLKNQAARESLLAAQRIGAAVEGPEETVRQMAKAAGLKDAVVSFTDQGAQRWFMVEDAFLLDAIKGIGFTGFQGTGMKVMQKFKKWLTIGVTVSPTFRIRNVMRDSLQMIGANPASYNVLGNVLTGWKATKGNTQEYASIMAGGGVMRFGTILDGDRAEHVKRLIESGMDDKTILTTTQRVKDALQQGWDWWQSVGDRAENVNRAALYKKLRSEGKTHLEASFAARDTMDFSMQGTWASIRFLSQTVPFFNARLQGLYKLGRGASEDPRRFGIVVGGAALASIALLLAYRDDDDWKKREDWDRETFWWFKIGDKAFRIPKPFEIGAIATIAERGIEAMISDEMTGKEFANRVYRIVSQQLSMNPVPQMAMPLIELYANRDSFTDRPIEGMGMERLSKPMRAGPYTSATAKLIGKNGIVSPVQIDHLVNGYFGWLGAHIVATADLALRPAMDMPGKPAWRVDDVLVVGDFVKDLPAYQSKYVTQVYDQMKEVQEAMADLRQLQKIGATEEAAELLEEKGDKIRLYKLFTSTENQLSKISQQIKMVQNRAGDSEEKRARLNQLYDLRNRLAKITVERAAAASQR